MMELIGRTTTRYQMVSKIDKDGARAEYVQLQLQLQFQFQLQPRLTYLVDYSMLAEVQKIRMTPPGYIPCTSIELSSEVRLAYLSMKLLPVLSGTRNQKPLSAGPDGRLIARGRMSIFCT